MQKSDLFRINNGKKNNHLVPVNIHMIYEVCDIYTRHVYCTGKTHATIFKNECMSNNKDTVVTYLTQVSYAICNNYT